MYFCWMDWSGLLKINVCQTLRSLKLTLFNIFSLYNFVSGTITSFKGSHDQCCPQINPSPHLYIKLSLYQQNVNHLCTLLVQILVLYRLTIFTVWVAILQVELVTTDRLFTLVADEAGRVVGLLQSVYTLLKW